MPLTQLEQDRTRTPPPVTAPSRRSHAWAWLVVLVVVGAGGYYGYHWYEQGRSGEAPGTTRAATAPGGRAIPVLATAARRGDLPIYLGDVGTVAPFQMVTLRPRVDGQIVSVQFTEGATVKEGDPLVEIDPRPFEVQEQQAEGQMARDQASLKNAQLDLARYQAAREAIAEQLIDTAAAAVAQYEGAVKTDQAQIANARLQLTYCHVTAPISGRVGLRLVDKGNMVHASDPNGLLVITQVQPITLIFSLSQDALPQVQAAVQRAGSPGAVPVEAYDDDLKTRLASGALLAVDNQIDVSNNKFRLKAQFANQDNALFPNQFVNARILVDTRKDAILIPTVAIQHSPRSAFVFVVRSDDTVEMRPVTEGPYQGEVTAITLGLADGEMVVTDGLDRLQDGTRVSVRSDAQAETRSSGGAGRSGGGRGRETP